MQVPESTVGGVAPLTASNLTFTDKVKNAASSFSIGAKELILKIFATLNNLIVDVVNWFKHVFTVISTKVSSNTEAPEAPVETPVAPVGQNPVAPQVETPVVPPVPVAPPASAPVASVPVPVVPVASAPVVPSVPTIPAPPKPVVSAPPVAPPVQDIVVAPPVQDIVVAQPGLVRKAVLGTIRVAQPVLVPTLATAAVNLGLNYLGLDWLSTTGTLFVGTALAVVGPATKAFTSYATVYNANAEFNDDKDALDADLQEIKDRHQTLSNKLKAETDLIDKKAPEAVQNLALVTAKTKYEGLIKLAESDFAVKEKDLETLTEKAEADGSAEKPEILKTLKSINWNVKGTAYDVITFAFNIPKAVVNGKNLFTRISPFAPAKNAAPKKAKAPEGFVGKALDKVGKKNIAIGTGVAASLATAYAVGPEALVSVAVDCANYAGITNVALGAFGVAVYTVFFNDVKNTASNTVKQMYSALGYEDMKEESSIA